MVGHSMWNEFVENSFNLQYLYFGISVILLVIAAYCTNRFDLLNKLLDHLMLSGRFEWWNLLFFKQNKQPKDYLIISLVILWLGLFLFSCGVYQSTLGGGYQDGF